jgi:hypothetical protein
MGQCPRIIHVLSTLAVAGLTAGGSLALAAEKGKLIRGAAQIQGLSWKSLDVDVEKDPVDKKVYGYLDGAYVSPDRSLVIRNVAIPLAPDGSFRLRVPLVDVRSPLVFFSIGPTGDAARESIVVDFPGYAALAHEPPPPIKRHAFLPSLGFTYISYSEAPEVGSPAQINEIMATFKLSYQYNLAPPRWNAGITTFVNLIPLSTSSTGFLDEPSAQFFGLNFRVGYVVPQIPEPWRLSIMVGTYYVTMFGSDIGFVNLMGPQLFPVLRRTLSSGDTVTCYLKLSPVGEGFAIEGLTNREMAFGGAWNHVLKNGRTFSAMLDFANLALYLPNGDGIPTAVSSTSFSLSAGLSF